MGPCDLKVALFGGMMGFYGGVLELYGAAMGPQWGPVGLFNRIYWRRYLYRALGSPNYTCRGGNNSLIVYIEGVSYLWDLMITLYGG